MKDQLSFKEIIKLTWKPSLLIGLIMLFLHNFLNLILFSDFLVHSILIPMKIILIILIPAMLGIKLLKLKLLSLKSLKTMFKISFAYAIQTSIYFIILITIFSAKVGGFILSNWGEKIYYFNTFIYESIYDFNNYNKYFMETNYLILQGGILNLIICISLFYFISANKKFIKKKIGIKNGKQIK